MRLVLDSCFILSCVKNKIDLRELEIFGEVFVPNEVLKEIKIVSKDKRQKKVDRENAELTLQILSSMKNNINLFKLNNEVDNGLLQMAKHNKEAGKEILIIATMDKELKAKLKPFAKVLVIKGKQKLNFA